MVWAKLATAATAFGQTAVGRSRPAPDWLMRAWMSASDQLPDGWTLDALHCASAGLSAGSGPDDWVVAAIGPSGERRIERAEDAVTALERIAASFDPVRAGT